MGKRKGVIAAEKMNLYKRVRDLKRLVSHEGTPEDIKKAKIAELKELRKKQKYLKEVEMFDARYKKIKFFELIKTERKIKKLKRQLQTASEDQKPALQAELQKQEDNVLYIKFFPSNEKYISLYASGSEAHEGKRQEILNKIKEKTKEKKDKLKAALNEEVSPKEEAQDIEEDEFFATEGPPKKKKEVPKPALEEEEPVVKKKKIVTLPKKRGKNESDEPEQISLKPRASKKQIPPPPEKVKVKKIEVPKDNESDNDQPQAISFKSKVT